jgi:hypothetical protein
VVREGGLLEFSQGDGDAARAFSRGECLWTLCGGSVWS